MTLDVVVIGAGPAGAVAARELARRGHSVLLVDKARFPRPKVCGCCINGAAITTLKRLGLGHAVASGVPLHNVTIGAGARSASVKLPGGVSLSREAFDLTLVREAVKAGAQFREGAVARIESTCPDFATVTVQEYEQPVRAKVVIVATGLAGREATPEAGSRIGAGVIVPADLVPAHFRPGTTFMATGRGGYVGLVRVEDGRLDVAAAFDVAFVKSRGGLGCAAESILNEVGWPCVPGIADLPWKGTPALTRRANKLAGERWFAIGDAAGYVEPFTGEGMAWAVASAAAVAPIAARAVHHWSDSLGREWERAYHRVIGGRQRVCRIVSRVLRSPALTGTVVRALTACPVLARPVVWSLNRSSAPLPHGAHL
ncbi:nad binding site : FAD dependent oxidoreductase OS=Isosphaera pallida (strain ATCC 43644 / DSM 9630 / IS1B) GN=Isop_3154 PE=4 SV=1: Lycopene_cycl [Gemmata massiliana]|uniref:FAD-binding domain-containing protein n=1 Tax=Gemmata massiliana TaxID=1210884 RepID=A0A6P2DGY5_9BACT|nr:FAD-dependent oxidoreductase [Gemmata massiliana]VTS00283.1 nad binding site : FAD dependent oxidoreductase OS=Isosphaera pallida (strain ATCC 43644 / DSM 9630 / IS1B) GN=Isop_3154 PE=4 SV=1: Lycopene_cycl [Gemmata massiliana]